MQTISSFSFLQKKFACLDASPGQRAVESLAAQSESSASRLELTWNGMGQQNFAFSEYCVPRTYVGTFIFKYNAHLPLAAPHVEVQHGALLGPPHAAAAPHQRHHAQPRVRRGGQVRVLHHQAAAARHLGHQL